MKRYMKQFSAASLALLLTACGGGSGYEQEEVKQSEDQPSSSATMSVSPTVVVHSVTVPADNK